jgi:hypothetical protein
MSCPKPTSSGSAQKKRCVGVAIPTEKSRAFLINLARTWTMAATYCKAASVTDRQIALWPLAKQSCRNPVANQDREGNRSDSKFIVVGMLALALFGLVIVHKYTGDFSGLATWGTTGRLTLADSGQRAA